MFGRFKNNWYLCMRDLKAYSQAMGGRLSYYHDRMGLEADNEE